MSTHITKKGMNAYIADNSPLTPLCVIDEGEEKHLLDDNGQMDFKL